MEKMEKMRYIGNTPRFSKKLLRELGMLPEYGQNDAVA